MVNLYVTEGKSVDPVRFFRNRVRIFLAGDMSYGLWIDEDFLFDLLSNDQKRAYLSGNGEESRRYDIDKKTAATLTLKGDSPYNKSRLLQRIESL